MTCRANEAPLVKYSDGLIRGNATCLESALPGRYSLKISVECQQRTRVSFRAADSSSHMTTDRHVGAEK